METPGDGEAIFESRTSPEAFDEIFRRYFPSIFRFAARQVGPDEGEEVAAEVFARAFANRYRFDQQGSRSAKPWLFGICINVMRSRQRGRARMHRAHGRLPALDGADDLESEIVAALDAHSQRREIWSAVESLRPAARAVLLLSAFGELDGAEIAIALGLPQGTVRSLLSRARRDLGSMLASAPARVPPAPPTSTTNGGIS